MYGVILLLCRCCCHYVGHQTLEEGHQSLGEGKQELMEQACLVE